MLFNSYLFIFCFLPLTLLGFFTIAKKSAIASLGFLCLASAFFYAWWQPIYLALMMVSIGFNYVLARLLVRGDLKPKKALLVTGIVANLGALAYFKYANFFVDTTNALFHTQWQIGQIFLPLAISFFTFQQIAFLVDCYRNQSQESSFIHYCLFITFFPQLIAGPIVHHREIMLQFRQAKIFKFNQHQFAIGLSIFALGLFKKVVFADHLSLYATPVFNAASDHIVLTFFEAWAGALAYTFQLYFDFSGYSDMAVGLSRMFGIKLPLNFNSPYKAVNIIDFWRRWHMTLSRFLRDYLYIPLGGNKKGHFRRHMNLLITMLLGGLWHGAGWTFVIWGALHGSYLIINHTWQSLTKTSRFKIKSIWLGRAITLFAVVIAWVFFRATSFSAALSMLKSMFGLNGISLPQGLAGHLAAFASFGIKFDGMFANGICQWPMGLIWIALASVIAFVMPNTYEWIGRQRFGHYRFQFQPMQGVLARVAWQPQIFIAGLIAIMLYLAVLQLSSLSEFIYFQF